ncbi:MAG: putative UDP-glucose 6-dehydrogenase [Anaerolineales bacterium]|nr:putative UDP-glucose 6-dehydrogenase [Anaerolineales bacterium]
MVANAYDLAAGADALMVCTEWNEFKQLDLERMRQSMRQPVLVDGRNLYEPAEMLAVGRGYGPDGQPLAYPSVAGTRAAT